MPENVLCSSFILWSTLPIISNIIHIHNPNFLLPSPSLIPVGLLFESPHCTAAAAAKSLQSCPTLCDPIDGSPTGSAVPGIPTGVGCHFLLQCMKVKSESEVAQSCPTLSNPMDCSLPGSSIHGILQARVLEWGAIAFSNTYVYICIYHTSPNDTLKIAGFCYRCTLDSAKLRRNVPSLPWMEWGEKKL